MLLAVTSACMVCCTCGTEPSLEAESCTGCGVALSETNCKQASTALKTSYEQTFDFGKVWSIQSTFSHRIVSFKNQLNPQMLSYLVSLLLPGCHRLNNDISFA